MDLGFWVLDFGFLVLDFGFWILRFGFWTEAPRGLEAPGESMEALLRALPASLEVLEPLKAPGGGPIEKILLSIQDAGN